MLNGAAAVVGVASAAFFLPPNLDNNLFSPGVVVAVVRKVLAEALSRPVRAAALAVGASSSSLIKEEDDGAADAAVASLASPPSSHAGDSPSISCTGVAVPMKKMDKRVDSFQTHDVQATLKGKIK